MTEDTAVFDRQGMGGNLPPNPAVALRENLEEKHDDLLKRRDELAEGFGRVPEVIEDDEVAGKIQDFTKQIAAHRKKSEGMRIAEKEPYLRDGRTVDGFFKAITDPLDAAKKALSARLTVYMREKEKAERRRREAEERRQREEAERLAREAAEAEKAAKDEADLQSAIEAEERAKIARADATKAAAAAAAKAADMSRTRGDFGSVGSLQTRWDFRELNRSTLDIEALRMHLPVDGLERAIRAFIKAGGRELSGVDIYENTSAVIR